MLLLSEALLPGTCQTARTGRAASAPGQGLSSRCRAAWIGTAGGGSPAHCAHPIARHLCAARHSADWPVFTHAWDPLGGLREALQGLF